MSIVLADAPMTVTEEKLRRCLVERRFIADASHISLTTTFAEMRIDSLDLLEMAMQIETDLNVELSDEKIMQLVNFGNLVDYVTALIPE